MKPFNQKERWLLALAVILLVAGLLVNLGKTPLNSDDALRGLTSMEMVFEDEYLVPTKNGSFYYRKPPLFYWLIIGSHNLFGDWSNFAIRFPVVLSVLAWALSIFLVLRRQIGVRVAALTALAVASCGHILFESSRFGRIDMVYSWIVWLMFMTIHFFYRKQQWWRLFMVAYFLAAIAWMTKGLPTVLFMGFTLMGWLFYKRDFKRFFSVQHVAGGILFLVLVGSYYYVYNLRHPHSLHYIVEALWSDSSERTAGHFDWLKFAGYLGLFPVKLLYGLLPWSLLIIALFRKNLLPQIKAQPLLHFSLVTFAANIIVYWISPGTNTRYLMMFFPLIISVLIYFHEHKEAQHPTLYGITNTVLASILALATLALIALPFVEPIAGLSNVWLLALAFAVPMAGLSALAFRYKTSALLIAIVGTLFARLAFDVLVIPATADTSKDARYRDMALEVADIVQDRPLYLFKDAVVNTDISVYLCRARNQPLYRHHQDFELEETGALYIVDQNQGPDLSALQLQADTLHQFETRLAKTRLYLVALRNQ